MAPVSLFSSDLGIRNPRAPCDNFNIAEFLTSSVSLAAMTTVVRFSCFVCDKTFSRQKTLDDHLRKRHGQTPVWDQALPDTSAAGCVSV